MKKYLAWDIEISKVLPEGETGWQAHMPLGISCMATYAQDESEPLIWHGSGDIMPSAMSKDDLTRFVDYLHAMVNRGYTILTWNGLGFDWWQLAFESGLYSECAELAINHVDPMFQVLCVKGFPVGLDAVSKGLGLAGKTEGMSGALAPQMWAEGKFQEVLDYVQQDVRATLQVALEIEKRKGLTWIAKSGRRNTLPIPRLLTAQEASQLPLPDTSWMTDPLPRERFTAWMGSAVAVGVDNPFE